jgi:flavin-binding protein dodecin
MSESGLTVVGVSKSFSFEEALDDACAQLKNNLKTDLVHFRVSAIEGENGGVVLVRNLSVTVMGWAGPESKSA